MEDENEDALWEQEMNELPFKKVYSTGKETAGAIPVNIVSLEADACAICLEQFQEEDQILVFECDPLHYFHVPCGKSWLDKNPTCPLCRKEFKIEA